MLIVEIQTAKVCFSNKNCTFVLMRDAQADYDYERMNLKSKKQDYIQSAVSHEMRTPLGIIMQLLDELRQILPSIPNASAK